MMRLVKWAKSAPFHDTRAAASYRPRLVNLSSADSRPSRYSAHHVCPDSPCIAPPAKCAQGLLQLTPLDAPLIM